MVAAILVMLGAGVWLGRGPYASARMGATYVAKQTCSCLFVAGRRAASCRTDYEPAAVAPLQVAIGAAQVEVSAFAGLVGATAQFEPGFGCHVVD